MIRCETPLFGFRVGLMSTFSADATTDTSDMLVVHAALRREFRQAPELVRAAGPDAGARDRVADHVTWLLGFLHHHHAGEDRLLWPLLRERAGAELLPLVDTMEAQHGAIAALVSGSEEQLTAWRRTGDGEELAGTLDQLYAGLVEHLALEEREVLPLAAAHVRPHEWARLGEEGMASIPGKERPRVLGMFMLEGDPATIRAMLADAPLPVRLLMPRLAPRSYASYRRKVQGSLTFVG